jgi:hypothetical protein
MAQLITIHKLAMTIWPLQTRETAFMAPHWDGQIPASPRYPICGHAHVHLNCLQTATLGPHLHIPQDILQKRDRFHTWIS